MNIRPFTPEEDITIQQAYEHMGNRWTQIAELLPGRTEDAVKMRWKALNPNQRTNAKPGRPRLMPGMNSSKSRSAAQMNPDNMIATTMMAAPPGAPMQAMYAYPTPYDPSGPMPIGTMPLDGMPVQHQQHTMHSHHHQHSHGYSDGQSLNGSELPEPSVEPLGDDHHDVDSKDAAMLKELLLRSQSNSLLSFGSSRGLNSFADMSPDELLASGELDEMLKAVSLANEGNAPSTSSMTSGTRGRLSSSFSNSRTLFKALESMGSSQDKHIFQELIDELRAGGEADSHGNHHADQLPSDLPTDPNMNDPNLYSFHSSSGRNLLHSLEFDSGASVKPPVDNRRTHGQAHGDDEDDEDDFSDLMKPIHRGKRY
jgi:hypothetical protein